MNPVKGYYSLIQFCPDASRLETVNVGVILLCPERGFLDARTCRANSRVRQAFGRKVDAKALDLAKRAMESRVRGAREDVRSREDLAEFARLQANALMITAPRPMRVVDPEADLEALYNELVGGEPQKRERRGEPEVKTRLDEIFQRPSLKDRIVVKPQVTVPVLDRRFPVPYAYQNGAFNLVRPEVFVSDENNALGKAEKLMAEAAMIQRHTERTDNPQRVIVIPEVLDADPAKDTTGLEAKIEALFREFAIRVVKPEELDAFAQEVEREAHAVG
jgi:hypothetical protein